MSDSNDGIPESIIKLLPPDAIPDAIPRVIGFIGTEILFRDLLPFIEKYLKDKRGDNWRKELIDRFKEKGKRKPEIVNGEINWDLAKLLDTIIVYWDIFKETLKVKKKHKDFASALVSTRHEIMHNDPFTREEADHALSTMIHLIPAINGSEDAIDKLKILRQWIARWIDPSPPTPVAQRPKKKPAAQRPKKKKDAEYYFNQGIINFHESNYDKAIEKYTQAIKLDPKNAYAYYNRASCSIDARKA